MTPKPPYSPRRSDLAAELDLTDRSGVETSETAENGFSVSIVAIVTDAASARLNRPRGRYLTLTVGDAFSSRFEDAVLVTARHMRLLAHSLCQKRPERVLVVGLGNRDFTADAIGALTAEKIAVTPSDGPGPRLFSAAPGVPGQTGLETLCLVKGICSAASPELIVLVDALCARSVERLAVTVQLGTGGIRPGSGLYAGSAALSAETLGVPVLAVGVPTIVDSATLVLDALEAAGLSERDDEALSGVLTGGRRFFVTPSDADGTVRRMSELLAAALNCAFGASASGQS